MPAASHPKTTPHTPTKLRARCLFMAVPNMLLRPVLRSRNVELLIDLSIRDLLQISGPVYSPDAKHMLRITVPLHIRPAHSLETDYHRKIATSCFVCSVPVS